MDISDSFTVIFLSLINIFIYVNNMLFGQFLASKPEGRKTILGKMPLILAVYKMIIACGIGGNYLQIGDINKVVKFHVCSVGLGCENGCQNTASHVA